MCCCRLISSKMRLASYAQQRNLINNFSPMLLINWMEMENPFDFLYGIIQKIMRSMDAMEKAARPPTALLATRAPPKRAIDIPV